MAKVRTKANQSKWKKTLDTALRWMCWTLILGILSVVGYDLHRFFLHSDFFIVRRVNVEGCHKTTPEQFVELAGIAPDANIFRLRTRSIVDRIRTHPWVEDVYVVRVLPETVRIVIREREPLAAVNSAFDGKIYGLDRHLVLLPEPDSAEAQTREVCFNLPIVTGLPAEEIFAGNRLNHHWAKRSIDLVLMLRTLSGDLLQDISEIHFDSKGNMILYPMRRVQAIYLGKENLERRTLRLCRVWDYLERHDMNSRYIDCRFDVQGVVTRPENLSLAKWNSLPKEDRNLLTAGSPPSSTLEGRMP